MYLQVVIRTVPEFYNILLQCIVNDKICQVRIVQYFVLTQCRNIMSSLKVVPGYKYV